MTFDVRRESEKLFQVILKRQGIKHRELFDHSQGLSPEERQDCLAWLLSLNKIREETYQPKRGPAGKCYWPMDGAQAAAATADQLAAATAELADARKLLTTALSVVDTAERRLNELQAKQAAQPVAA
jgi:hypothetical protein